MKNNHLARIEHLEQNAQRWEKANAVYTSFEMENNTVRKITWSQKDGFHRDDPIEFETARAALDWMLAHLGEGVKCHIYLDDVRGILNEEERLLFNALYFDAPQYRVMFDLRPGQDFQAEAIRLWRHFISGLAYLEWWETADARVAAFTQRLESAIA